jgi:hypothetical protein
MHSKEVEMIGRLHAETFNVPRLLVTGVNIQVRFTKAKDDFYLMNSENTTTTFKFLKAKLKVNVSKPNVLTAHHLALAKGGMIRLDFTRI